MLTFCHSIFLIEFDFLTKFNFNKLKPEKGYGQYGTSITVKDKVVTDEVNWYANIHNY